MQANAIKVRYEELRSIGFASLSGAYVGVGAAFQHPLRLLKVNNVSDANLIISFDGITDMDFIAAQSAYVFDFSSNASETGGVFEQPAGQRFYVREESAAATEGSVYVTVIYAATS